MKYSHKMLKLPSDNFFQNICNTVINNKGITYINCSHGRRRTGLCVAYYEKHHTSKHKSEILEELKNLSFNVLFDSQMFIKMKRRERLQSNYDIFVSKYLT